MVVDFGVTKMRMDACQNSSSWHLQTGILVGLILQLHILAILIVVVIVQSILTVASSEPVLWR